MNKIGEARAFADAVEELARAAQHIVYGDMTPESVRQLAVALSPVTGIAYPVFMDAMPPRAL